ARHRSSSKHARTKQSHRAHPHALWRLAGQRDGPSHPRPRSSRVGDHPGAGGCCHSTGLTLSPPGYQGLPQCAPSPPLGHNDADVAHNTTAAAIPARPTRVAVDTVALNTHAEFHLGKFHWVILLRHIIDGVRAIRERPGSKADPQTFDAQGVVATLAIQTAQHTE